MSDDIAKKHDAKEAGTDAQISRECHQKRVVQCGGRSREEDGDLSSPNNIDAVVKHCHNKPTHERVCELPSVISSEEVGGAKRLFRGTKSLVRSEGQHCDEAGNKQADYSGVARALSDCIYDAGQDENACGDKQKPANVV
jgi:hypothetical protein